MNFKTDGDNTWVSIEDYNKLEAKNVELERKAKVLLEAIEEASEYDSMGMARFILNTALAAINGEGV